jgi:hypothetical protein
MPPKYKEYQNKYIPYHPTSGDYIPPDFDADAYPDQATYEAKLQAYLEELKPYVHHLQESVRLRQLHFERQLYQHGIEEEPGHRYFRLEFTKVAQEAVDTLNHWNTIHCMNQLERQQRRDNWHELKMRRRARIDYDAKNVDIKCKKNNYIQPRVTHQMKHKIDKEKELQRTLRAHVNEKALETALTQANQKALELCSLIPKVLNPCCSHCFWSQILEDLKELPKEHLPSLQMLFENMSQTGFGTTHGIPPLLPEFTNIAHQYAWSVLERKRPPIIIAEELSVLSRASDFSQHFLDFFINLASPSEVLGGTWTIPIMTVLCRYSFHDLNEYFLQKGKCTANQKKKNVCEMLKLLWRESIAFDRVNVLELVIEMVRKNQLEDARKIFAMYTHYVKDPLPLPRIGKRIQTRYQRVENWALQQLQRAKDKIHQYQKCGKLPK